MLSKGKKSPKKAGYMRVRIEDDLESAGDAFAVEILKAFQYWNKELQIGIQLCTGDSPFIGYRKIGGERLLQERGLYNPGEFSRSISKYGRVGAILDSWDNPKTQAFLKNNGLNPGLKPDMKKVIVFAVDAIFPQKRSDYFAFANLLNNICDLWGIKKENRFLFYGDIYVTKQKAQWNISKIPDEEFRRIRDNISKEGLRILEYQAACLINHNKGGFALNSDLRMENGRILGRRLKRNNQGDFQIEEAEIKPLKENHIQYKYLEGMRNQALMMHDQLVGFGGMHITLLGVGPSYKGEGHIGFCERNTPPEQTCFIGAINDYDATFHISATHAKEFSGFKNMFVTLDNLRMPGFGFITFGPADLMYRRKRDTSKAVIVIVIATGNLKSNSVARAVEGKYDYRYPLSLTQNCRGVYVLDRTSARELSIEKYPCKLVVGKNELIRPYQIVDKLKAWNVAEGDSILLISPHMDDDFLAMMHLLRGISPYYNIHVCYISLGYTAVYSDYILKLLGAASMLNQKEIDILNPGLKEELVNELIKEKQSRGRIPNLDYEVFAYMGRKEKLLRAKILLIDLNERYDLKHKKNPFRNKFRTSKDIAKLRRFLAELEKRKAQGGEQDIDIMRFLKASARFMEAVSGLVFLGIPYKNIRWPLEVSFYGIPGRPLAVKEEDVNNIKAVVKAISPRMVIFNGEGFPDFTSHSNTETATFIALFKLLKERSVSKNLLLLQWAGVWDRIMINDARISVILTRDELRAFYGLFNYFYPTQAPYAPALNASSAYPQSFAQDVIENAHLSAKELIELMDLPADILEIFKNGGGVLNYKIKKLKDQKTRREFLRNQKELNRSQFSMAISSNAALTGPAPYPERLNELSSPIIGEMFIKGAISQNEKKLFSYRDSFELSNQDMLEIVSAFKKEMGHGLAGRNSSLAMLPTFVDKPSGKEKGAFLALDLGGSRLRVLMVYLAGNKKRPGVIIEKYSLKATGKEQKKGINYDYTRGNARQLFDAIARYIKIFLTKHGRRIARYGYNKPYNLGFTFSFPVKNIAIDKALVSKLAKDFLIPELINQDAVLLLRKAISNAGLEKLVNPVSLNNDTVATLVAERYRDINCDIGGIIGTGTNLCYIELTENIHKLKPKKKRGYTRETMIINIESGNFDKVPRNFYDLILDSNSTNRGEHITEKMVSGLYLGELTRLVLVDLISKGFLFRGKLKDSEMSILSKKGSFQAPFMTKIEEDTFSNLKDIHAQIKELGIRSKNISLKDREIVKQICSQVTRRAARITAAVIFAVVTHIDEHIKTDHTVAIDGSLFEKHPPLKKYMEKALRELSVGLFNDDRSDRISLKLSPDASGIGAAMIAATVSPRRGKIKKWKR